MVRIDSLLIKCGLDSLYLEGDDQLSDNIGLGDQLAGQGIDLNISHTGLLLLLLQCHCRRLALIELMHLVFQQSAQQLTDQWRGFYPQQAVSALASTAVKLALKSYRDHCFVRFANVEQHCQKCQSSQLQLDLPFQIFSEYLPVQLQGFEPYRHQLEQLVDWLKLQRQKALQALSDNAVNESADGATYLVA